MLTEKINKDSLILHGNSNNGSKFVTTTTNSVLTAVTK